MIESARNGLTRFGHAWDAATSALDGATLTVALVLLTAILAAVGGMFSGRMRLYGALMGAMLVNAVVKGMGGGFEPALAAMIVATMVGFALGSTPFLVRLVRRQHKDPRR
jgi:hypothetical protein